MTERKSSQGGARKSTGTRSTARAGRTRRNTPRRRTSATRPASAGTQKRTGTGKPAATRKTPTRSTIPSRRQAQNAKAATKGTKRHTRGPQSRTKQQSSGRGKKQQTRTRRSNRQNRGRSMQQPKIVLKDSAREESLVPPLKKGTVRVIPLGGVEEVGRNMTAFEYDGDIVVVDCGFQFQQDETPGIDYILPNTQYLEDNIDKVRGMAITHGHLDHIGGIPYIIDKIGYPKIYARKLTAMMIKKRQDEFPDLDELTYHEVENSSVVTLGKLKLRFFSVTHTIPDSMGIIIETPHGDIVVTSDIKLDHVDGLPTDEEQKEFKQFAKRDVLLMCADSTNAWKPGWSTPERTVFGTFEQIIKDVQGRMVIGVFASQLERISKIIEIAERHGKHIVVEGRSMKNNIDIVKEMGILKTKKGTFISADEMEDFPPDKVVILATGAQGDQYAALVRMANKTHRSIRLTPRDTVVLSASVIPGNEVAVQKLKDNLARQGVRIITYQTDEVHASGHGNREELMWIHNQVRPKFFMPMHGHHFMLREHADLAAGLGMSRDNIAIPDNGSILEISEKGTKLEILKEKAPANIRMVDGFAIGSKQEVVIRDRQSLASDGMFVIIATVNLRNGKLRKSPDIISRGFVYLRESQDMLQEARVLIKKTVEKDTHGMNPINLDYVKEHLTDIISSYLLQKSGKRPMVIPVLIGI